MVLTVCTHWEHLKNTLTHWFLLHFILLGTSQRFSHLSHVSMGVFLKKGRGNLLIIFLPSISLPYTLLSTSFLVCSSDKHYSTSQHQCGLDLSMTRQFFEKLSRKEKVLKEVALKFILFAQFTTIWDLWQVMSNLVLLFILISAKYCLTNKNVLLWDDSILYFILLCVWEQWVST